MHGGKCTSAAANAISRPTNDSPCGRLFCLDVFECEMRYGAALGFPLHLKICLQILYIGNGLERNRIEEREFADDLLEIFEVWRMVGSHVEGPPRFEYPCQPRQKIRGDQPPMPMTVFGPRIRAQQVGSPNRVVR